MTHGTFPFDGRKQRQPQGRTRKVLPASVSVMEIRTVIPPTLLNAPASLRAEAVGNYRKENRHTMVSRRRAKKALAGCQC